MSGSKSDFTFDFSTLLPAVNRTSTLVKFFGATVDQVFQPGTSKTVSGYIGEVPLYNNANTDFYVNEPTEERSAYQLEPAMVSFDTSTTSNSSAVSNALTYPDFVAYLMNSSAITNVNQPRLFENNYFTWAPPIDIDKLVNYSQYRWLGNTDDLPVFTLTTPVASYASTGQTVFSAPAVIPGLTLRPAAFVNGSLVSSTYNTHSNSVTLANPATGSVYITLYNNLLTALNGVQSADLSGLANYFITHEGDGFTQEFFAFTNVTPAANTTTIAVYINGVLQTSGFELNTAVNPATVIFTNAPNGVTSSEAADVITIVTYNGLSAILNASPPSVLDTSGIAVAASALTSGMIVSMLDTRTTYQLGASPKTYFTDNVGVSARFTNSNVLIPVVAPQYITIDRSSIDQNAWSLHNYWVHEESYAWSGITNIGTTGSRPIIEFVKDIVLYNYGKNRVEVDALMTQPTAMYKSGGTVTPITLGQINYKPLGTVSVDSGSVFTIWPSEIQETGNAVDVAYGSDFNEFGNAQDTAGILNSYNGEVDEQLDTQDSSNITGLQGIVLRVGMVLLVIQENGINQLFNVTNDGSNNILLLPVNNSNQGDYFTSPEFGLFDGIDIHYDINTNMWIVGGYQEWSESVAPLFYLYNADATGIPLDDKSMYPGSNFAGSEIFSYAVGTGAIDSVLLQPLRYDANGYIVFENKTVTDRYTYNGGTISGLYCYGTYVNTISASVSENMNANDSVYEDFTQEDAPPNYYGGVLEFANAQDVCDALTADNTFIFHTTNSLWLPSPNISEQSVGSSFPGIPPNLQANPLSEDVTFISLSDWNGQFTEILENQAGFTGNTFSANNYRDTARNLALGTEIVQHQAPMLKSMLLSSVEEFDVPNAIRFASGEYKKFKNKFMTKIVDISNRGLLVNGVAENAIDPNDPSNWMTSPSTWVMTALNEIKANYNSSFPFSLSTMAGGNYFIPPTPAFLGVLPPTTPQFVTDLTYSNQTLFIRGHDGSYVPAYGTLDSSGFSTDWRDYILLALETQIYKSIPSIAANNTGDINLGNFIQESLNFNIKTYMNNVFYQYMQGYGYMVQEVNSILISSFEQWTQQGKFDYRTYGGYDQNNPFTWNYSSVPDRFGNVLPGNWRGIYQWYFDTDHPHTRPWEMLGFAEIPDWWIGYYGNFYASTNTLMWHDIEQGYIAQGPRQGLDPRYERPGLHRVLPVDPYGNLLDPVAARIVPTAPTQANATKDWVFGDWGPVESQWRNSSSYKFALSEAGFLMKPPQFTEILWDTVNYGFSGPQWVDFRTLNRPSSATDLIHGELDASGNPTVVIGIQQWIVDGLVNIGKGAALLGQAVRNLDVRMVHQMAGFVSSDGLKAISDTFGLLPSENVQIALYNAPAFDTETYSGVIVEWTGGGYRVVGYDNQNAYFNVFPPNKAGPKGVISISSAPEQVPNPWRPNTFYTVDVKVLYKNYVYQCNKSHTSGPTFDNGYWTILGQQPKIAPRVVSYGLNLPNVVQIPYGTVLPNIQAVADFLLGWQAWLVSRGWSFTQIDASTGLTKDWVFAVKEFLGWSQVSWAPGNFVALSPGAEQLNFVSPYGTVLNVEDAVTGFFGLLDRSGNPISSRNAYVSRLGSQITLEANNADIYGARLRIAEVEHILVFSNTTIFNDILYIPLFNLKQPRLKLIANVSTNWNGRLSAPGFVLVGNNLVANFDKNAEDIRTMFDIEKTDRTEFLSYARHNIGYQARTYMEDLLLSDTEQFEFFQGMIQAKGSPGVFERLLRSTRINDNSDILFLEEWAIRQCHFGAPFNPRVTLTLPQNNVRADPQLIVFNNITNASPVWIQVPPSDPLWLDAPTTQSFFPALTKMNAIPSAGPVRLSEVNYTSFAPSNLGSYFTSAFNSNLSVFNTGERVWIYDNNIGTANTGSDNTWDVWRAFDIGLVPNPVIQVSTPTEDPTVIGMRVYFQYPLTITEADIGSYMIITNSTYSTPDLIGVQTITGFDIAGQWIEVDQIGSIGYTFGGTTLQPLARVFRSVRFADNAALNATIVYSVYEAGSASDASNFYINDAFDDFTLEAGSLTDSVSLVSNVNTDYWNVGDLVWVNNDSGTGLYAVRMWDGEEFVVIRNQPVRIDPSSIITSTIYEATSQIVNSTVLSGQQSTQNGVLVSDQPLIDNLVIVDPIAGFIPGVAEREIMYRIDVDPAMYNSGLGYSVNPWGADQIGQVWWDLSTCRYLNPYTDLLGVSNDRDITEITHRVQNWAMIAPNSSIDVYEWVQSSVSPFEWASMATSDTTGAYTGTVYNAATPSYVQQAVYSPQYGTFITMYYFWVKGRTVVPDVPFRHTDISTVTSILTNPSSVGTPWIAPIMPNGLLVSGVQSSLDNTSSALMVEITNGVIDKTHAEWILIDQNDSLSLPPVWMWRNVRDSLGGFDNNLDVLPNPSLSSYRSTGIYQGQNMFTVFDETTAPQGLLDARESYVGIINNILARSPTVINNAAGVAAMNTSDESTSVANPYLYWSRQNVSSPVIPPPAVEYSITVYDAQQRNALVATQQFKTALVNNSEPIYICINGTSTNYPFWSIWEFDPVAVNIFLNSIPHGMDETDYLYENAQQVFTLATAYDVVASTYANMLAGIFVSGTLVSGSKVFVEADETADGFWTVYTYNGGAGSSASSFVIRRAQLFRTNDFIETVDWFAQNLSISGTTVSYSASNPPTVNYATTSLRDQNEGTLNNSNVIPNNQFVSIGSSSDFQWTAFDTTIVGTIVINGNTLPVYTGWTVVAQSKGTISLSSNFYESGRVTYGLASPPTLINGLLPIIDRDGSWEIRVLVDILNAKVLSNAQINEVFFSLVHFVHTQQNSVDWIFKTSFMTIGGFAIPLTQTGIVVEDPTADLVDYINEVKPYRVKIRDYSQQYSIGTDQANVTVTDFDLPVYLDPTFNTYLPIIGTVSDGTFTLAQLPYPNQSGNKNFEIYSQNVAATLATYPWDDWNSNFLNPASPVRRNTIKLLFDRNVAEGEVGYDIPNYSTVGFDNGAEYSTVYVPWLENVAYIVGQVVNYNNDNYECKVAVNVYPSWEANNSYSVGAYVNYNHNNYVCAISNNTASFVTADWTLIGTSLFNILDWILLDNALVNQTAANRILNYYNGIAINSVLSFSYGTPDVMNIRQKGNEIDATVNTDGDFDVIGVDTEGFDLTVTSSQQNVIDGGELDGTTEYETSINAPTSDQHRAISDTERVLLPNGTVATIPLGGVADPLGYGLRDPYIDANVPEERVPLVVDDTVLLTVSTSPLAGAPVQSAKVYDVSSSNATTPVTFSFDTIPESNDAVMVFRDGLLASQANGDYTVQQLDKTIAVNLLNGSTRYNEIHVHAFGSGSNQPFSGQFFLNGTGSRTYELGTNVSVNFVAFHRKKKKGGGYTNAETFGTLQVGTTVGGVRNSAWALGSDGTSIIFDHAPSLNEDVVIKLADVNYNTETCIINVQILPYKATKSWTLGYTDAETFPLYAGTLVYVNGKLLMPPLMYNGAFTTSSSSLAMDYTPNIHTNYVIYYDSVGSAWEPNVAYTVGNVAVFDGITYVCVNANTTNEFNLSDWALNPLTLYTTSVPIISSLTQTSGAINDPKFAFLNNTLVSQNSNFVTDRVSIALIVDNQYTLNSTILKITTSLSPSDVITVVNFQNASVMNTQTYTYAVRSNGQYPVLSLPATNEYALVSYNGLTLSPDADYQFTIDENGNPILVAPNVTGSGFLVIIMYAGEPYRDSVNWLASTTTPAPIRMAPQRWDNLSVAEQGSVDESFTFGGDFVNYLSFIALGGIIPDAGTDYSLTVNGTPYTDAIPIITVLPAKNDGDPSDPQFAFFGSSLISLNYNFIADAETNGNVSPAVAITINGIPVPLFADLDGWAGLIPYYPQDENPYDHAVINQNGVPQPAFVYTMKGSWQNIRGDVLHTGTLVSDLLLTSTSLVLNLNQLGVATQLQVQNPFFVPTQTDVGILWIEGERIEYQNCIYNPLIPNQVTINGLRRGTNGTSITETRLVQTTTTPITMPYQTQYVFNTVSSSLANGVVEVAISNTANGRNIIVPQTNPDNSVNYTVTITGSYVVTVTLTNPTDIFYIVSLTLPLSHIEGVTVYNGNQVFSQDVPFGPPAGDKYIAPINYIENN
jgi:hypothetical protein